MNRVEIPPHTDAWMSGDRYGVIEHMSTISGQVPSLRVICYVRMDKSGRLLPFFHDELNIVQITAELPEPGPKIGDPVRSIEDIRRLPVGTQFERPSSRYVYTRTENGVITGGLRVEYPVEAFQFVEHGPRNYIVRGLPEPDDDIDLIPCIEVHTGECDGKIEYRMALSGTGTSYPRCDKHWNDRLDLEQILRERHPTHPPADFDPTYAGESWDEDY